ncbi:MAG TPA: Xaa-Pro peptidase family protein [Tepidisphaeraceae bacterium]|nr:Xaa-Pro peptidase family protein [Tepidisphaeraceae bacterium]
MLDPNQSKGRQKRLLAKMQEKRLDAIVVGAPHHVYYLGAFATGWPHQSALVLFSDGRSWICTANAPATGTAADEAVSFEAQWLATLRQEQPIVVAEMVRIKLIERHVSRVGMDSSQVTSQLALMDDFEFESIDEALWQQRRVKDADELALIERAIKASEAMYDKAREMIAPGVLEIDVFSALHDEAVKSMGEIMMAPLGNDYRCGGGGGPPRADRRAQDGELYIIDVGPLYRGYFADNCRTFAVNRKPTDAQHRAWQAIVSSFDLLESTAKPGARCREIYEAILAHLEQHTGKRMPHHLGHGIGLQPHEYPHLNPKWDDVLMEGEVFAAEPGVYGPDLAAGIRIENDYVVTKTSVRKLLSSPMEL